MNSTHELLAVSPDPDCNEDYLNPIIADADTGHGGITATMKLAKMFIDLAAVGSELRDGKQHVDITWQLGERQLAGSGRARSKKQARREAAKKLLKLLPVGKEAEIQMRKQMLQGLRYKLSAEAVVEDGVAGAVNDDRGLQQIYRVLWKVPRPQGRVPAEVSAEGRGSTVAEAQADAWENLYIQARRKNLHAAASQAVYEEREERKRQQLEDAAEQRQQQVNEGMSILTSEAASELAVRHNTAKDETAAHEAGYHCVLHWAWEDPSGESRSARSSGLGSSKRQARGEAMQKMLAEQGFGSFEATALNDATRVRGIGIEESLFVTMLRSKWLWYLGIRY
eukprot:s522_g26.t1